MHGQVHPDPTERVRRRVMRMRWEELVYLHWPYPPEVVQQLLPERLRVDTFDGVAWVGLIPFRMKVSLPGLPYVSWPSVFPETNVRTYVRAGDGSDGVWFFSLEADRLSAVLAARAAYRLPYMWSAMSFTRAGQLIAASTRRRWPGRSGASSEIAARVGPRIPDGRVADLDHFLTARWRLYSVFGGGVWQAPVEHTRWPLHEAELVHLDDDLVAATGLPVPDGRPRVLSSPGVEVRIGLPRSVPPLKTDRPPPGRP